MKTASKSSSLRDFKAEQVRNRVQYHRTVAVRITAKLHDFCQELAMKEGVRDSDVYRHAMTEYAIAHGFDPTDW